MANSEEHRLTRPGEREGRSPVLPAPGPWKVLQPSAYSERPCCTPDRWVDFLTPQENNFQPKEVEGRPGELPAGLAGGEKQQLYHRG